MKWSREKYIELMTFGKVKDNMFSELFGPLIGLEDEWKRQGATQNEINMTAFDWDYVPIVYCGGNTDIRGGITPRIIEETVDYIIEVDNLGRSMKLCKGVATIPLPLNYPVKDMDSWMKVKPLYEFYEDRIDLDALEIAKRSQKEGSLVLATIPGGFDMPRQLMGEEECCISFYEQPELIHDMLDTVCNTSLKVFERICDKLIIDNLMVHEDMAGKSGPLIGPKHIEMFIKPYYRKIWDMLSSMGTKIFSQDSDGNMTPVIDAFLDCGVNVMFPMEPAAGMDTVELRKKYGTKVAFKGGIDKHVLREDKEAIRKELEYKMQPIMQQGGMVFGLDHRIPNGTSIENYRYYVSVGRELLGLPSEKYVNKEWIAMGF